MHGILLAAVTLLGTAGAGADPPPQVTTRLGRVDAFEWARGARTDGHLELERTDRALAGSWRGQFGSPGLLQEVQDAVVWRGLLTVATTGRVYQWRPDGGFDQIFQLARSRTLLLFEGDLIVGGLNGDQNIYRFDGNDLLTMGDGLRGDSGDVATVVHELTLHDGSLFAAGSIEGSGPRDLGPVARWDGDAWQPVGEGLAGRVFTIESHLGTLWAGGDVTVTDETGRVTGRWIARWAGGRWLPAGGAFVGRVRTLESDGAELYAGGLLPGLGPVPLPGVARRAGDGWHAFGHFDAEVRRLRALPDGLWAGGRFGAAPQAPLRHLAVWNGTEWREPEGGGVADGIVVNALLDWDGRMVAGGAFGQIGRARAQNLGLRDAGEWGSLPQGFNQPVRRLRWLDGHAVAAGDFTRAGGIPCPRVAAWRGDRWSGFGAGLDQRVYDVAHFQGELIAAGRFERSGTEEIAHVARWNGTAWEPLGGGTDDFVYALLVHDERLYAAGSFSEAGGAPASGIAAWNGTAWEDVDGGVDGGIPFGPSVYALTVSGGDLIAAGAFTSAGGVEAANLARLHGGAWEPIAEGLPGWVLAVADRAGELVAGGAFPGHVRTFRGGAGWEPIGGNLSYTVVDLQPTTALEPLGLVACQEGSSSAWFLAEDDWEPVVIQGNRTTYTVLPRTEEIWFGGSFDAAGGVASRRVALWKPDPVAQNPFHVSGPVVGVAPGPALTVLSNPFRSRLRVSVGEDRRDSRLELFDVAGRRLLSRDASGPVRVLELDTGSVPAGVYFLRRTTSGGMTHRKVVKVR